MIDTMCIRRGDDYFSLNYQYELHKKTGDIEDQFIIPDGKFMVSLEFYVGLNTGATNFGR